MTTEKALTSGDQDQQKEGTPTEQPDIIDFLNRHYEADLEVAINLVETTATDGFQRVYHDQVEKFKKTRLGLAKRLAGAAERLEEGPFSDDDHKDIKGMISMSQDLNIERAAWQSLVVYPIENIAYRMDKLIRDAKNKAENRERGYPLHNSGLIAEVGAAIAKLPRVQWREDLGKLVITEP